MKTLVKCGMAMLAMFLLVGCGSNKKATNPSYSQSQQEDETEITIPCYDESRSTPDFYRELGIGTEANPQSARDQAVKSAKAMVKTRLGGVIKGISTDYSKNVSGGGAPADKVGRLMEQELTQVIDKMLNDADNPCEKLFKTKEGAYRSYYVIEISKKEFVDNSLKAISENDELKLMYDRDKFREYAKKYMSELNGKQQ